MYIRGRIWGRKPAVNWIYVSSRNSESGSYYRIGAYVRRLDLLLLV